MVEAGGHAASPSALPSASPALADLPTLPRERGRDALRGVARLRGRADEGDAVRGAGPGERGVLGQEPVAGVQDVAQPRTTRCARQAALGRVDRSEPHVGVSVTTNGVRIDDPPSVSVTKRVGTVQVGMQQDVGSGGSSNGESPRTRRKPRA